jgi:hypothetical protein
MKMQGAWFATAGQAISWFRKRRSAVFEQDGAGPDTARAKVPMDHGDNLPGLRLRIHRARRFNQLGTLSSAEYIDIEVAEALDAAVSSKAG